MSDPYAVLEATWPPAETAQCGPVTLLRGLGGGKRVSAATADTVLSEADLAAAEQQMKTWGQQPLFMIRPGMEALDAQLAAKGYETVDPTLILEGPIAPLTDTPIPRVTAFVIWEPLAIMCEIWATGGTGPERLAVMDRVKGPKTAIFGRSTDKPAGTAFVAIHDGVAMVHSVEVLPALRRQGVAQWMMRAAAFWAQAQGADRISVAVTQANTGAQSLYASLGLAVVGHYHYRAI